MPVLWAINHPTRLVEASAKGVLHLKDVEDYLQGVAMTSTLSYRKIFDMTQCSPALSKEDMVTLSARLHGYKSMSAMGPAAIVASSDESYQLAHLFETLTSADRPLKVFRELQAAHDWLDSEPTEASKFTALDERRGI